METGRIMVPVTSSVCFLSPLFLRTILNLIIDNVHLVKSKVEAHFSLLSAVDYSTSISAPWETIETSPIHYTKQEEEDARKIIAAYTYRFDGEDEEEYEETIEEEEYMLRQSSMSLSRILLKVRA
jgi:hypothetical protein